jgi:hypothetical protein
MVEMLAISYSLQMYWSTVAHERATHTYDAQRDQVKRYELNRWKSPLPIGSRCSGPGAQACGRLQPAILARASAVKRRKTLCTSRYSECAAGECRKSASQCRRLDKGWANMQRMHLLYFYFLAPPNASLQQLASLTATRNKLKSALEVAYRTKFKLDRLGISYRDRPWEACSGWPVWIRPPLVRSSQPFGQVGLIVTWAAAILKPNYYARPRISSIAFSS